jgi:lactoylglutathione lyase
MAEINICEKCFMRIEHLAIWTEQLELLKEFYCTYFGGKAGCLYQNPRHDFKSYFIEFEQGARLELMQMPVLSRPYPAGSQHIGWAHLAFALGSEQAVAKLTEQLVQDGYTHLDGPRRTGDGYYESTVLDPEGNRLELTV